MMGVNNMLEAIKRLVRAQDPATSVAAAERSTMFSGTHKGRILLALKWLGTGTADDISMVTGLSVVQVDRRLPELARDGVAEVLQLNGDDVVRNGFRVWRLKKISAREQQSVGPTT